MAKRTPLYARHAALGAKLVDFGGWDMRDRLPAGAERRHPRQGPGLDRALID